MAKEKKRTGACTTVLERVQALDEFKKPEYKRHSNSKLAKVTKELLKLSHVPDEKTIRVWKKNENCLRQQAASIVEAGRQTKKIKNLQPPLEFEFQIAFKGAVHDNSFACKTKVLL